MIIVPLALMNHDPTSEKSTTLHLDRSADYAATLGVLEILESVHA